MFYVTITRKNKGRTLKLLLVDVAYQSRKKAPCLAIIILEYKNEKAQSGYFLVPDWAFIGLLEDANRFTVF